MGNLKTKLTAPILFTLLVITGCTKYADEDTTINNPAETTRAESKNLDKALFHVATDSWIAPQKDPYSLKNFQQAYDNLSSGKSVQTISKSVLKEFSESVQLKATHYSLKIYPKNEKEQGIIESMEDVKTVYIPFDYVPLTDEEIKTLDKSKSPDIAVYPEKSRYSVTYDDWETIDGPIEAETYIMPVLYAVWPCGKPLPEDMDYEIEGEVFIPNKAEEKGVHAGTRSSIQLSESAIQILENEAIILALGIPIITDPIPGEFYVYKSAKGRLCNHDNFLNAEIPMPNLKVRFQLGSNIWEYYTDADGYFVTERIPVNASFSFTFQHTWWKITKENSTIPVSNNYGTISTVWGSRPEISWTFRDPVYPRYTIHRAINYYYFGGGGGAPMIYHNALRIIEINNNDDISHFSFSPSGCSITIECYPMDEKQIGMILHELGHYIEFKMKGYNNYVKTNRLFRESWASYVGWYLGENYYKSLG